uniref:SSD domain-containing protein n=1 Tax=Caenorhabditis japonica TaxID=281687 RepID=A0A8R1HT13_CAEJA
MQEGEEFIHRPTVVSTSSTSRPKNKTFELLGPFSNISLADMYKTWGNIIGRFPIPFVIATVIMCSAGLGIIGLQMKDNVRDGYTPSNSEARFENRLYREFLESEGDPVMTTVLITAKDEGSMHRISHLEEAHQQWLYISKNLEADVGNDERMKFSDFCGHYCQANDIVGYFLDAFKTKSANPELDGYHLNYPIATIMGYKLHLERNFFGVTVNDSNSKVTNIVNMKVLTLPVLSEVKTYEDTEKLNKWELAVYNYATEYSADPNHLIEINVIGAEVVDTEMNKDAQKMVPYFVVGIISMILFIFMTVSISATYYGYFSWRILLIALACLLVPILAIVTAFGINNMLGNRTNSPMMIMPFLINGIGVNDAFLTLQNWLQHSPDLPPGKRLGYMLAEAGPSITTTTLTNVIVFLIGWMNPTEEMSIFCLGCAISLLLAYVYTLTFFCPVLVLLLSKRVKAPSTLEKTFNKFLEVYAKIICSRWTFLLLLIGSLVYWGFGVYGTLGIRAVLNTAKILPLETPIRKPNRIIEETVWKEFYPVTVIVNNPVNISNSTELDAFKRLVHDFESMKKCRGTEYTISPIRDYETYFYGVGAEDFDYEEESVQNTSISFDFSKLSGFLANPIYKHHKGTMKLNFSNPVPIRKMQLIFAYENVTSWDDRIQIMKDWRHIAKSHENLNVSVWNVNAMFVDQMLSLKGLAIQNALTTLGCMAIVCVVFIRNPLSVGLATAAILSISVGVTGYLCFWDLDLDPVTLCAVIVSIGMSVDFVAHVACHYQVRYKEFEEDGIVKRVEMKTPESRVVNSLSNVLWPMVQSAFSTLLCVLPLAILQNYLPMVFVKTILLVVIWGMAHGLILLPCILAQFPLRVFDETFSDIILGRTSSSSCSSESDSEHEDTAVDVQEMALIQNATVSQP